jgi:hypothetical protein
VVRPPSLPQRGTPPIYRPAPPLPAAINLEHFVGVKLAAWLGGLALFLGIIFFVKYSMEHGWISPALRIALGFTTGTGLVIGGLRLHRAETFAVLAQTLCATGVLALFGVTYAGHHLYHLYPASLAFGLMVIITAIAFWLATRLQAQVVAILGILGGFLTPILCRTGQDHPGGLFSYIALLDIGLLMVGRRTRWRSLAPLGALGTFLMQWGWVLEYFSGHYTTGSARLVPLAIFIGFAALFTLAVWRSRATDGDESGPCDSAIALCGSALLFGFVALDTPGFRLSPGLLYSFIFLINAISLSLAWAQPRLRSVQGIALAATALHLGLWTIYKPEPAMLPWALGLYLGFGIMHTLNALLWQRRHPELPGNALGWIPLCALVLMLLPVLVLDHISFIIWPAILLVNAGIIALAAFTRKVWPVVVALAITFFAAFLWMTGLDADVAELLPFLIVIGGFAAVFAGAAVFLAKRLGYTPTVSDSSATAPLTLLPIVSAVLPFGLLILASMHFRVFDPSPLFGLALLLVLFLFGLAKIMRVMPFLPVALACTTALELAWHSQYFSVGTALTPLSWYVGFYALFTLYPRLFRDAFEREVLPWVTAAFAGVTHFFLIYHIVRLTWPNDIMGLLPAAFIIAPLLTLHHVLKRHTSDNPARLDQLAWLGGTALLFITLIFPIQFSRQWLTVAWALEGAALSWLYLRVPHQGMRLTGFALLCVAFVRLVLNPAVFSAYERSGTAIWNWHLYAYGLAAASCFAAARWLAPPRDRIGEVNACATLWALGGVLCFVLLNIEIADYFTPPGHRFITLDFSLNLARDMTYSMAWALFALTLLIIGIAVRQRAVRFTALGLLGVTLLKLFLHDLSSLDSIYRVGALMVVAVIALVASFLYQRFLAKAE